MRRIIQYMILLLTITAAISAAALDGLRGQVEIDQQGGSESIPRVVNSDLRQVRNYPMQPPVIPHSIRNYQIDLDSNKCMTCHSRQKTGESQAPMVSVTHYMDRDGNFLAEISPRRYFCNQCHVNQHDVDPVIENEFVDMYQLIKQRSK